MGIHRPGPWPGRRGSPPSSLRACWSFVAQGEALAWEGQAGNTLPSCPCEEEPASPHPARLPCPQVEPPRPPSAGCSSPSAQGSGRPARAKPGARRSVALLAARIVPPCFVRPGLACPSGVSTRHPNKVRAHESSAQARLPGEGRLQKEVWLGDSLPAPAARSHSGSAPPDAIIESTNTGFFFFPVLAFFRTNEMGAHLLLGLTHSSDFAFQSRSQGEQGACLPGPPAEIKGC